MLYPANVRRLVLVILLFFTASARADQALEVFTNQANAALLAQFGFGLTNLPIYSPTNSSIRYSAAIHYQLQGAANAYDETTPATSYPSVFRPLFAWQGSNLFIVGYTNVTADFDAQFARGFKEISDPSITLNDNVWGIPWVVGAKDNLPQFYAYSSANVMSMTRKLMLVRPNPSRPNFFLTNQILYLSASNIAGFDAWNTTQPITSPVEIIASNECSVILTNNYNWGTNTDSSFGTNETIFSWPADQPLSGQRAGFETAIFPTSLTLPLSIWSDISTQMQTFPPSPDLILWETNRFSVHAWQLRATNRFVYALVDSNSGVHRVLDFVNLGPYGMVLDWNWATTTIRSNVFGPSLSAQLVWQTNAASDGSDSPPSLGVSHQIQIGAGYLLAGDYMVTNNSIPFLQFLLGRPYFTNVMDCPFQPTTTFAQQSLLVAQNPKVHYALDDLEQAYLTNSLTLTSLVGPFPVLPGGLGSRIVPFRTAKPLAEFSLSENGFKIDFGGLPNLPYMIWSSTNLSDWYQLGVATQTSSGLFQFTDPTSNSTAKYYRIITP